MAEEKREQILQKYHKEKGSIISLLQDTQAMFGYIPEDMIFWLSNRLNIPASNFYGVATFYAQFYLKPRGENVLTVCCGTACHVKGSAAVISRIRDDLEIPMGEDTTEDTRFTLESVACVGACSIAPVLIANRKVYGKVTSDKVSGILKEFDRDYGNKKSR
jgi:NADH:ubiquinone oxidoreductase subunit E